VTFLFFPSDLRGPLAPLFDFGSEEYLCNENSNIFLAVGVFGALVAGAFFQNHGQLLFLQGALQVRGAMIGSVYMKVLRLSSLGLSKAGSGFINNIAANDTENLLMSAPILSLVVFAPVQITFSFILLAYTVGATFLAGFAVVIIVLLLAVAMVRCAFKHKMLQLKFADQRIKLTGELLAAARVVKSYGWEKPFQNEVMKSRRKETHTLLMQAVYFSVLGIVIIVAPVYLSVATFSTYAAVGNKLTPDVVFTALSVLNLMRFPLAFLPFGLAEISKILASFMRLQNFLLTDELVSGSSRSIGAIQDSDKDKMVKDLLIEDAEFGYHYEKEAENTKGKGKGKGCCGCFGKKSGKGKGKGKDDGKGGGKGDAKSNGNGKQHIEVDESRLVDVKMASGRVEKMSRALTVKRFQPQAGGLTMVVGPVGSGKTTLLTALLGELETIKGAPIDVTCTVGYSAQIPWIINSTVEGNVKFGDLGYDEAWYDTVIDKCCLRSDFEVLPAGDQTEIGERGVNLSGGQKARVALARAVYTKASLFLFDDPLAAVDPHVAKKLFTGLIGPKGLLAGTTRILVTHQVQYLPQADQIIVVDQGEITATGTYDELSSQGHVLEQLIEWERQESGASVQDDSKKAKQKEEEEGEEEEEKTGVDPKVARLSTEEEAKIGKVGVGVYKTTFLKYWGLSAIAAWVVSLLCSVTCRVITDLWLATWVDEGNPYGLNLSGCILVYAGLAIVQAFFVFLRITSAWVKGWVRTSQLVYNDLLGSVFRSPTVFFDTTPSGRILNRFTADIDIVDNQMPRQWTQSAACIESVLVLLIGMVIAEPMVGLFLIPACSFYGYLANFYRHIARDVQRLEGVTKTPIFSRLSETLGGLSSARAFGYQELLIEQTMHDVNNNQAVNYIKQMASSWLGLRLEVATCVVTTAVALIPTQFNLEGSNAALIGVGLTYGLESSRFIQALTKFGAEMEQKFTSMERVYEYCELPSEAATSMPVDMQLQQAWPNAGCIEYRDVTMTYRAGLLPALKGLSFTVQAGEKLGVVGRTGSGKSSIIVSLLRLTECDTGQIFIDGTNTRDMGLQKLRQSLSMIPQEPVLFGNMTLRRNLDPFDQFTDDSIKEALVKTQMDKKEAISDGLTTLVTEGGTCFSVGERQLLCLARAMLRNSRITLLDEATASVDNDTDDLIQTNIRETFKDATVLCIAHRIRTIIDSDKILVMNAGVCKEFGTPQELLRNKNSYFRESCEKSGIEVPSLQASL
jgi:ABC-type multidrug transport system fused ATPase/permease subunit